MLEFNHRRVPASGTAIVFILSRGPWEHQIDKEWKEMPPVQYAPDILMYLALLSTLALAWGYLIQETGSLWGSELFHAGADLMIILGIYTTYAVQ